VTELPDWLTPLPDAEAMRATDRWAIEQRGVPSLDLMERAGAGAARTVEQLAADGRWRSSAEGQQRRRRVRRRAAPT